jgi:hypothetical protein
MRPIEQNNHDFDARVARQRLEIQLTELVDRSFLVELTRDDYDSGRWQEVMVTKSGELPKGIDVEARDNALWFAIKRKLDKLYSKPRDGKLWLVIFTTQAMYMTEFLEGGILRESNALRIAREKLDSIGSGPFDEIWFIDLLRTVTRVFPRTN